MKYFYLFISGLIMSTSILAAQERPELKPKIIDLSNNSALRSLGDNPTLLRTALELDDSHDFQFLNNTRGIRGLSSNKYQQFFKGIKVEFGNYFVHSKEGEITKATGDFVSFRDDLNVNPRLSENAAFARAKQSVGARSYMWQNNKDARALNYAKPTGELVVLPLLKNGKKTGEARLAYKFDIYASNPVSRDFVYVDAINGEVLFKKPIIVHAEEEGDADTRYYGTKKIKTDSHSGSYRLRDSSRGDGVETYNCNQGVSYANATDFTDNDNNWTSQEYDNAEMDNAALDAHWGAQMTYDYFKNKHNRDSWDGNGAAIKSYVHYSKSYINAFWDGSVMTYGDGDSDQGVDPLTSVDVVAHEIGHGVCQASADLVYSYEPGALNESFSDIWAASVEYMAAPEKDTWLLGESFNLVIRSLSNPNDYNQPDTYKGDFWYSGSGDNGGVHYNSGVLNYWFYLLSVGGKGTNDIGTDFDIPSIGIDKAASVAYRMLTVYLGANSQYIDARNFGIESAKDLFGEGSNEHIAVHNAFNAVGIGGKYGEVDPLCSSSSSNSTYEWISNVTFADIDNDSSAENYSDYTSISTDVKPGSSYDISITASFSGSAYSEGYAVWIDFDQDNKFEASEKVFSKDPTSDSPVSGSVTIPDNALKGKTTMRVSMKYNSNPTACENFSYGEVEDYSVNVITGGGPDTEAPSIPGNLKVSDITKTSALLSWDASTDNDAVLSYDIFKDGQPLANVPADQLTYSAENLAMETEYTFTVYAIDNSGNTSEPASVTFTTLGDEPDTEAPSIPGNLKASDITKTSALLSWDASTDNDAVLSYDIFKDGQPLANVPADQLTYLAENLAMETEYTFTVYAIDNSGNTSEPASVTFTTLGDTTKEDEVLLENFFEDGFDGWFDGGADARWYTGNRSFEGQSSIELRDNSGRKSAMSSPGVDLRPYASAEIKFYFYANSFEVGESFIVRYKSNNSSWETIARFTVGDDFENSEFYVATVTMDADSDINFSKKSRFRIQADASGNGDQVYIDQLTVTGKYSSGEESFNNRGVIDKSVVFVGAGYNNDVVTEISSVNNGEDFRVFPNPVQNVINIRLDDSSSSNMVYSIKDFSGNVVKNGVTNSNGNIDVSSMEKGFYIIEINNGEETITKKIIKK